ncbi:MAG: hypothetical protein IJ347_02670 [Faecalibacterium sp.]|nr:hypothetical protein [Faecalibacterium sp.]
MGWLLNNLLLWGSILWVPALMHVMLCNEAKFKKNMVVGVTLPFEARQEEQVTALLAEFRKQSRRTCWGLTLAALPCLFIRRFAVGFVLWGVWMIAVLILPNVPFARCNQKLKELKRQRGWQGTPGPAASLTVAAQPLQWLSPLHFILPFLLSLLPLVFEHTLWGLYLLDAAMVLLFWVCYRWAYRRKADAVDENEALTAALTRIRRRQWNRCWLWCSWYAAALNLTVWLAMARPGWMMAGILAWSVLLTWAVLDAEWRTRTLQERLTAQCGTGLYLDEDDQWPWGLIYYNPNDCHLMVNNRVGMGTTFNMAKRPAQIIMAGVALLLLAMPLGLGLWFWQLENATTTLTVTENALVAEHTKVEYEIPLEQIETVELLEELPAISRIWGTGMDSIQKGSYSSPWGNIRVCIDPRGGPWLLVTTTGGAKYLIGSGESAAAVYQILNP